MVLLWRQSLLRLVRQKQLGNKKKDSLNSSEVLIRVVPSVVAILENPTLPHNIFLSRKQCPFRQRDGGSNGDCQGKADNAMFPKFGCDLFGVKAGRASVEMLPNVLINASLKIVKEFLQKTKGVSLHVWKPKRKRNQYLGGGDGTFQHVLVLLCALNR